MQVVILLIKKYSRDGFNDLNKEEFSRYDLDSIDDCDFVVDLEIEGKETQFEPIYSKDRDRWEIEAEFSFLDAEKSHKLFRAFYVPFVSDQYCTYSRYEHF